MIGKTKTMYRRGLFTLRSHLVTVATGPRLSDALISSPVIVEDGAVPGAGFEFGIDPNEDPELALVSALTNYLQGGHQPGNHGKVGEFKNGQGKVRSIVHWANL